MYFTLAGALAKRGIAPESYGQLWDSLSAADQLPCPLCFTYASKRSPLRPLPAKAGKEPVRCEVCQAIFYSPITCELACALQSLRISSPCVVSPRLFLRRR
jgi:hypothetical protein